MSADAPVVLATAAYRPFAAGFARRLAAVPGEVDRRTFPDGERYLRIPEVAGRHAVVVGGTVSDGDTLEIFDLACAAVEYGAERLSLVIPYFGYSTMERAVARGEAVTAKNRARVLSAIPRAPAGNHAFLLDLHAEGIPHYFENGTHAVHVYAAPLVTGLIREMHRELSAEPDLVVASTDAGRAAWVESLAFALGAPAAFVYKRRIDGATTEITGVSAAVEGRVVIIYDDMIRTGGSLTKAAAAYRAAGARAVGAVATHGVFPGDSLDRIVAGGTIDALAVTNSHPGAAARPRLRIADCAGLLADAVRGSVPGAQAPPSVGDDETRAGGGDDQPEPRSSR